MSYVTRSVQVRLRGGLGNQLYGFAVGWVIADRLARPLVLDGRFIPWEGSNENRELELDQFTWTGQVPIHFRKTIKVGVKYTFVRLLISKLKELFTPKSHLLKANVGESISDLDSLAARAEIKKSLQGYFQDIRWVQLAFDRGMPKQLCISSPSFKVIDLRAQINEQIAVHIRLGDFLDFPDTFSIPSESYYLKSIESLRLKAQNQNLEYWVFTDGIDEAHRRFPQVLGSATRVISDQDLTGVESLFLMSEFRKIVTSNSSFSIWAGLFSSARGGLVVCPAVAGSEGPDFRPLLWIRVEN